MEESFCCIDAAVEGVSKVPIVKIGFESPNDCDPGIDLQNVPVLEREGSSKIFLREEAVLEEGPGGCDYNRIAGPFFELIRLRHEAPYPR